ncbi:MAG: aldo/keto reductase, partial [Candidatus Eremiobacteraeota bacterium]|nr:aldo/keto reductase [Candidatus Eremiobacteraeota bacterium]
MKTNPLGRTDLRVSALGFGGAPIGGLYTAVDDAGARAALQTAWDRSIRYFDTAPLYGAGLSEERLGTFLADKPRDAFVVSSKVGRVLVPADGSPGKSGSLAAFAGARPYDAVFDFSAAAT